MVEELTGSVLFREYFKLVMSARYLSIPTQEAQGGLSTGWNSFTNSANLHFAPDPFSKVQSKLGAEQIQWTMLLGLKLNQSQRYSAAQF